MHPIRLLSLATATWLALAAAARAQPAPMSDTAAAEAAIVATLEAETRYFCERDLARWSEQWVHAPYAEKLYAGDTPFLAFVGWDAIRANTAAHIADHPAPIPIPAVEHDYAIELFGPTALVRYSKAGEHGPVRETRLMLRQGDAWRILRMQTIY